MIERTILMTDAQFVSVGLEHCGGFLLTNYTDIVTKTVFIDTEK